jgi:hypothetical protein
MGLVWNHPPNWPPPPAGWQPADGWRSDPSWPPAPAGWRFWIETSPQINSPQAYSPPAYPAQYAPTYPQTYPYGPPVRPKRRLWLKVGLPVGVVALLIVAGIVGIVIDIKHTYSDAKRSAGRYVAALQAQDFRSARGMLCAKDQAASTGFVAYWQGEVAAGRAVSSYRITGMSVDNHNGHQSGEASVDVSYADGSQETVALPVEQTSGTWHPCPVF